MCWSCDINKLKAQEAEKDINVKKLLGNIVYFHLWIILII